MQNVKQTRREMSRLVLTGTMCLLMAGLIAGCTTTTDLTELTELKEEIVKIKEEVAKINVQIPIIDLSFEKFDNRIKKMEQTIDTDQFAKRDEIGCRTIAPIYLRDLDKNRKNEDFVKDLARTLKDKEYDVYGPELPPVNNNLKFFNAELRLDGKGKRRGVSETEFYKAVDVINGLAANRGILLDWVPYFQCYGGVADLQYVSIAGEGEGEEQETISVNITLLGRKVLPNSKVHIRPADGNIILTGSPTSANSKRLSGADWEPVADGGYTFGKGDEWGGNFQRDVTAAQPEWNPIKQNALADKIYVMITRKVEKPIVVRDENNQRREDSVTLDVARYLRFEIDKAQGVFQAEEIKVHNSVEQPACPCDREVLDLFQREIGAVNTTRAEGDRMTTGGITLSKASYGSCSALISSCP